MSGSPSISPDGRYVAFVSDASNLVARDTNAVDDVFVRDRKTGTTTRVSVSSTEAQGDRQSTLPSISADGRFVTFSSAASNLVRGDTNDWTDVFVRDRRTGTTARISVRGTGAQANHVSEGPSISADGRYVAFTSYASNLVSNDTNGRDDIFVRDRKAATTTRASVSRAESQANYRSTAPSISADGRYVAFTSYASNLVSNDTNGRDDIFVRDRRAATTSRVTVSGAGAEANYRSGGSSVSGNGRYVAFWSFASNLVAGDSNGCGDVFVRDRRAGTTSRVSISSAEGQDDCGIDRDRPSISTDGRYIAFVSRAFNLVPDDTNGLKLFDHGQDVFVRDRVASVTERVSVSSTGEQANHASGDPSITADGRNVAFTSYASNLVADDTNGDGTFDRGLDVFIRAR